MGDLDDKYGLLTIKTPQSVSTYLFPGLLKEFQLIFPRIGFDIDWCTSFNLTDLFHSGTIDMAFLITDNFEDKNLHIEEISKIELVLAVHPQDEILKNKKVTIHDLNNNTLLFAKSECNYKNILQRMLIHANVQPKKVIEINSLDAIKRLLLLGNGIAFIPEIVIANELKNGSLKTLNWSGKDFNARLIMIWSKEKHISEPLEAFILMVRKMIKD